MSRTIQELFDAISRRYELANHLFTLYLDSLWRNRALSFMLPVKSGLWIDLCTGTGELIDHLRQASSTTRLVGIDFSHEMLGEATRKRVSIGVDFALADVHWLPFHSDTFDLVTISFATRNLSQDRSELVHVFHEFLRVLKPGGVLLHLETSQPPSLPVRLMFHLYVRTAVRLVGSMVGRSLAGYSHLSRTVCDFYGAEELSVLLRICGFGMVKSQSLLFGAIALHRAIKPE